MGSKSERKKKSHSKKPTHEKDPNELYFGYKPNNNRFGDNDLATPFIWKKKWEKTLPGLKGERLRKEVSKRLETRKNLLSSEIIEVKKLRAKRQEEQDDMERIRDDLQRMADRENFGMLNEKEEAFHKEQVREGAIIRIREEREKAFDEIFKVFLFSNTKENLVVKDLCMVKMFERLKRYNGRSYDKSFKDKAEKMKVKIDKILEIRSPLVVMANSKAQLREIREKTKEMITLTGEVPFWVQILALADFFERHDQSFVSKRIEEILHPKSLQELNSIKSQVEKWTKGSHEKDKDNYSGAIDVEYWVKLLPFVNFFIAKKLIGKSFTLAVGLKIRLKERFEITENYEKKQKSPTEESTKKRKIDIESPRPKRRNVKEPYHIKSIPEIQTAKTETKISLPKTYSNTSYLSLYIPEDDKELEFVQSIAISQNEFFEKLANDRMEVLKRQSEKPKMEVTAFRPKRRVKSAAQILLDKERSRPTEKDEEVYSSGDVQIEATEYWWQEKFRPRKPLYFNRIKTGFDFNRYNKAHYDSENPPPKIIQGYRFNIFYPDLINIKTTPKFSVIEIPGDKDYVLLKFEAGAPYEEIAFKIVNREWNQDTFRGYRSIFSNGVLQLSFNFQKYFYRR